MSGTSDPDPASLLRELLGQHRTARNLVFKGARLREIALSGLRADRLDLEDADLGHGLLKGVKWSGCCIRDARLDGADLSEAVLRSCDLDQVRAQGVTLVRARIENSTARGARFDRSDFTDATLIDSDFSRASLRAAVLENAAASGADFRGADLREANLRKADLCDADLRGADLRDADLTGAELTGADLRGAELDGAAGDAPALRQAQAAPAPEMPAEIEALSRTMAPIVAQVLHSAGAQDRLDPALAHRLQAEAQALQGRAPASEVPDSDAIKAVSRMLGTLGPDLVPSLLGALAQPGAGEPPPEVKTLIRSLGRELSLGESATAEEILERLTRRS